MLSVYPVLRTCPAYSIGRGVACLSSMPASTRNRGTISASSRGVRANVWPLRGWMPPTDRGIVIGGCDQTNCDRQTKSTAASGGFLPRG